MREHFVSWTGSSEVKKKKSIILGQKTVRKKDSILICVVTWLVLIGLFYDGKWHSCKWSMGLIIQKSIKDGDRWATPLELMRTRWGLWCPILIRIRARRRFAAIHHVREDCLVPGDSWQQAGHWQRVPLGPGAHAAASGMWRLTSWQSMRTQWHT